MIYHICVHIIYVFVQYMQLKEIHIQLTSLSWNNIKNNIPEYNKVIPRRKKNTNHNSIICFLIQLVYI